MTELSVASAAPDARSLEGARLKVRLLSLGLRVELDPVDQDTIKPILRVRSGSCGGLDLVLPDGTWVNCPVREVFARSSPLCLRSRNGQIVLIDGDRALPVELLQTPSYYAETTSGGAQMSRVAQLCSDRVGVGMTNICTFFRSAQQRCRFCSIGHNVRDEIADKEVADVVEAVLAALDDPVAPARHVLLGGGTPGIDDAGARRIAEAARRLREHTDARIYAMIAPPRDFGYLEMLAEAGVDEIGLNVEVFDEASAWRFIPGKHREAGFAEYERALARCVELFGPLNTRSITVVGLDPMTSTVRGVGELAAMGVLPILSPLRPLSGTQLEHHRPLDADELWELTLACAEAAGAHGVPLGPLCIACQSNTMTVPGHAQYSLY